MYITVQSFNQRSFSKIYPVISTGNDVKQMETLRDTTDSKEEEEKKKKRRE